MKKGTLHLKLAKALFRLAQSQQKVTEFQDELTELAELVSDKSVFQALESFGSADQSRVSESIKKVFDKHLSAPVINLLILLICSHQLSLLPFVQSAYQKYHFEKAGIADYQICTGRELSDTEKAAMTASISKTKKAHLSFSVDSSLIGGVQIYENGLLTDCTVKNQLEQLRRALLGEHLV